MWLSEALSPLVSLIKVLSLGPRVLLPGLSHRPAPGEEGQDLVVGSPTVTSWNEAGVDPLPPKEGIAINRTKRGN